MLTQLRQAGFRTAVLSNGSVTMLNSAVRAAGLIDLFDAVLSADAVKVFKPHPRVYAYGLEKLGLRADQVSFQSSNAWDAFGASHFGLRVVWCNRYGHPPSGCPAHPTSRSVTCPSCRICWRRPRKLTPFRESNAVQRASPYPEAHWRPCEAWLRHDRFRPLPLGEVIFTLRAGHLTSPRWGEVAQNCAVGAMRAGEGAVRSKLQGC